LLKRILRLGLCFIFGLLLLVGGLWFWYTHRPLPDNVHETLFAGVTYAREIRDEPRPLVIHVVSVELDAPGVGFLVTPSDGDPSQDQPLRARKTSQFLAEFGAQVAVNGGFFQPWHSDSPWDYYPHVGDPVGAIGFTSSRGIAYAPDKPDWPTLYLAEDNRASFDRPIGGVYNAISGQPLLVQAGKIVSQSPCGVYCRTPHPRTAIALDRDARRLLIVVVDGRQPNYSEGVTLTELSEIILTYGGYTALNLDGGGSTTLVMEEASGQPRLLNSPIDNRIPGRERPVGNHLGVFALQKVIISGLSAETLGPTTRAR
jgi:hypothetical protein